jgi:predicted nuclease with RNAse H fold
LTGSESRPSGWCVLRGAVAETKRIADDDVLIAETIACAPDVVSIDSPLALPFGRIHAFDDDPGRARYGIMRECERILRRRGIRVYPTLLPSMQKLTTRGIALAAALRARGLTVIESYPGGAQDILALPRKLAGTQPLADALAAFVITGAFTQKCPSHHELDAITSAIVGLFYVAGQYEALGSDDDGYLIVPRDQSGFGPASP